MTLSMCSFLNKYVFKRFATLYACGIILYKNGKAWVSILLIDKLHLHFSDYLTNHEKGRCNLSIALNLQAWWSMAKSLKQSSHNRDHCKHYVVSSNGMFKKVVSTSISTKIQRYVRLTLIIILGYLYQ